jgi:tetratricopeptide (TPR) repeat protein
MYDRQGRYADARNEFLACVRWQPENRRAYEYLALIYEGEQQYDQAVSAYEKAIELEQKQPSKSEWPYLNYGILLSKLDRNEEALKLLQQAAHKSPGSAKAQFEFGRVLLQVGSVEAAKTSLLRALEIDPTLPRAHYFLGNAYQRLHETEKADESWARFKELQKMEADKKVRSEGSRP